MGFITYIAAPATRRPSAVNCLPPMLGLAAPKAVALLFLLSVASASAQSPANNVISSIPDDPQEELRKAMITQIGQTGLLALEGTIDPNEYIVGPGDVFNLIIGGIIPMELPLTVSVSGELPLPEVGSVQAGGRSLEEVKQEAVNMLRSRYANASVSISLAQARSFYVHVTGAVTRTGRYLMLPQSRISDVIHQAIASGVLRARETVRVDYAMSEHGFRPEINDIYKPALRNIQVQHVDGTETLVDFTRYQTTGNTAYNPVLRDGDRVNVPAYHTVREGVRVSGDVAWPGLYDWRPDDTVWDVLDLAMGGRTLDETVQFRVMRWDGYTYSTILDQSIGNSGTDSLSAENLMSGDHITVYERKTAMASIEGWVAYPGEYRIEGGVTTLTQLVELAGGTREGANLGAAILERMSVDRLIDAPEMPRSAEESVTLGSNLAAQFTRGFQKSFSGEIGSHVAIDIAGAIAGSSEDIVLYDGDRLVFPRDEGTILITGHVPRPGYVTFVPGMPARYYIELAGGLGPAAKDVYIYRGSSGSVRQGLEEPVLSGDTIFIDWLEELTMRQEELTMRKRQFIISSISAATGLAVTAIVLFR